MPSMEKKEIVQRDILRATIGNLQEDTCTINAMNENGEAINETNVVNENIEAIGVLHANNLDLATERTLLATVKPKSASCNRHGKTPSDLNLSWEM